MRLFCIFGFSLSKYDRDLDVSSDMDCAENQNVSSLSNKEGNDRSNDAPENPRLLVTLEPSSKRKRGRPAGKSINKRKAGATQARRTRARIVNKPAKISGNESDDSVSREEDTFKEEIKQMEENHGMIGKETSHINKAKAGANQARRARARTGKRPAKISGNESDDSVSQEESKQMEESDKRMGKETLQNTDTERAEEYELSKRHSEIKKEGEKNIRQEECFDKVPEIDMTEKYGSKNGKEPEKLEVMTDPVHAMLLDMIPSLGKHKIETTNASVENEKPPLYVNAPEPSEPKKKKVSYRDVASELLKDW